MPYPHQGQTGQLLIMGNIIEGALLDSESASYLKSTAASK